ncbi:MAG: TolC family protein [Pirellulaceae bacterium]
MRLLIGLPESSDGQLIRPSDEPSTAETLFDWQDSLFEAANRRVELRRQNWTVRRRELELLASKNLTQVQLDLVGQYTWRGFGDDLFGTAGNNASAYRDLFGGDLQGWGMGLELSTPIGNRLAHSAVRNAELALAKEKAILEEQHRAVNNDLSNAFGELDRAYIATRTAYNQVIAAQKRLELTQKVYEAGNRTIEFVLDAQSALADAEARYHQSMVDYSLAVSRIHYARGTYLDYMGIDLSEGPWCAAAHRSAAKEAKRFVGRSHVDEVYTLPCPVTRGRFEQHPLPRNPVIMGDVIESVEVIRSTVGSGAHFDRTD